MQVKGQENKGKKKAEVKLEENRKKHKLYLWICLHRNYGT